MIRALTLTCIVLLCFIRAVSSSRETVYGVLGEHFQFKPIYSGDITGIVWKFTNARQTMKVVDWESEYGMEEFGQFKSRVDLSEATGHLTVRNLTAADSGHFVVDINSKELEISYDLKVMARVPNPTIKHEISKNDKNIGYLTCEGKTSPDQTFSWEAGNGTHLSNGSELTVHRTNNPDQTYICILKNLASKARSAIKEKIIFRQDWKKIIITVIIIIIILIILLIIPCLYANNQRVHDRVANSQNPCIKACGQLLDRIIGVFPNCAVKYPPQKNNGSKYLSPPLVDVQGRRDPESEINLLRSGKTQTKPGPPEKSDPQMSENEENTKAENGPGNDAGLAGNQGQGTIPNCTSPDYVDVLKPPEESDPPVSGNTDLIGPKEQRYTEPNCSALAEYATPNTEEHEKEQRYTEPNCSALAEYATPNTEEQDKHEHEHEKD